MKCPYCIKVCTKCNKILIAYEGNFYKKKGGRYGLHTECKTCRKQYFKQWKKNNFDHCKEYDTQWRENNREHYREYKKQYYKDNEEYYKELSSQWRKNNPDKRFNYNNSRRLKEESQGRGITSEQWYKMMEFFEWKCAYSGEYLGGDNKDRKRTVDHIIPLDNGGLNEPWNCVPMYRPYNTSKHTKNIEEWYKQQDFFSEERLQKIYEWQEYAYNKWNDEKGDKMKENKILGFFTNDGEYYDFGNELTEEVKEIFIEFVRKLTKDDDNKNIKEIVYKK